jgi:DMSO/TMAO reductase YedYZ molybdopterin-dependent catalytic subunit
MALGLAFAALTSLPGRSQKTPKQPEAAKDAVLSVRGNVEHSLSLTLADLKRLPRKSLKVTNPHEGKEAMYEGVPLIEILKEAGVPLGSEMRGPALATYVEASAKDGYRVLFSLPELDPDFEDSDILVADTMNGAPLPDGAGPLRLVAPHEKRPARWIRMLTELRVVHVPATSSAPGVNAPAEPAKQH